MNLAQGQTCSQRNKQNRTNCVSVDDLFAKFTTKRKIYMCTSREDNILVHEKKKDLISSHDKIEAEAKCDSKTPLEKFNGSDNEV
ncbi:hypothetical protein CASFOL_008779 [Castilleja foliolosa]|uniref:Uncharacterized protein n=1 Tax=Castilleja foliolosa TaxID=1961234 RepID=A0ABD3CBI5_9LAMI